MCDYFTGILTKGGRVLTDDSHSHTTIKEKYKLNDKKEIQDFLLFEIKPRDNNEFAPPTKANWQLLFESSNGQGKFEIPEWYKASYDRKIWTTFGRMQDARINEKQKRDEEESKKKAEEEANKQKEEMERAERIKNGMSDFKIVFAEPSYLKNSIDVIKEMCNEGRFVVTKDKLRITEIDPAHVCLFNLEILSSVAIELNVIKDIEFSINLNNLHQILRNCKATDIIELINNPVEKDKILLRFKGSSLREYTVQCIDMIEKEQNVPSLTFDTEITMNSAKIEEQIVEADTLAESVVFHVLKDVFDIKAKSDMNELKISNRQENNAMIFSKAEVKSTYSIEYLKKITRSKKISEDVIINFSTDYPLKMKYAEKDKVVLTWILAPRVENI